MYRSLIALAFVVLVVPGCCTWKEMMGSADMVDVAPTVDVAKYKRIAVMSVRPMPGDPALTEVEKRLVQNKDKVGLTIYKGDQLGRLHQMAMDRLNALQANANFQQQMAQRKADEQQKMADEAAKENMALASGPAERNAEYAAYAQASEGISQQYQQEVQQIFTQASANASQFGMPELDAILFVDLKEFGRPSYFAAQASGIPVGGGHTIDVNVKTVTLHARVGWSLVDPRNGQIIASDVYECEEEAVAELGGAYCGSGGNFQFDLGGLQTKLWDRVGFTVAENFYPHQVSECEEKPGSKR